jgi:hypothetical protein
MASGDKGKCESRISQGRNRKKRLMHCSEPAHAESDVPEKEDRSYSTAVRQSSTPLIPGVFTESKSVRQHFQGIFA